MKDFDRRQALQEVDEELTLPEGERPMGLVFLVTCKVSARIRKKARERCGDAMECHFWAVTELDEKVENPAACCGVLCPRSVAQAAPRNSALQCHFATLQ